MHGCNVLAGVVMGTNYHDFNEDLSFSHSAEDMPMWEVVYAKAFPNNSGFFSTRDDGQMQRLGIDRTLILNSGKAIYINEKVRRKSYSDILLEYIGNDQRHTLGWVEKPLFCDYIAYAFVTTKTCYILPVPQLQKAWFENKTDWIDSFGSVSSKNFGYNTISCPVPVKAVFVAMMNGMMVTW